MQHFVCRVACFILDLVFNFSHYSQAYFLSVGNTATLSDVIAVLKFLGAAGN